MLLSTLVIAVTAAVTANAHMTMVTPVPYGASDLNNSPLAADGSDYPCKQRGANTYNGQGVNNQWPIGSTQTLSFKGSAVHGGGSCQVSLTTDKAPTKSSKFFVIHSIIGGCPSNHSDGGNLPSDPNGSGANKYTFTVPDGVAPGEYTMAWTWFNRIGNREMYMNCAPVVVTGSTTKRSTIKARKAAMRSVFRRANFPDMFVANIGNGCGTSESSDVEFPNPGDSFERDAADGKYAPPTGNCASGTGSPGSPPPAPAPSSSSVVPAQPSPTTVTSSVSSPTANPNPPAPIASSVVSPPSVPSSNPSSGSTGALTGACETGMWNCLNGGLSFQRCGSGVWSPTMSTAAGAPCKVGTSASAPW